METQGDSSVLDVCHPRTSCNRLVHFLWGVSLSQCLGCQSLLKSVSVLSPTPQPRSFFSSHCSGEFTLLFTVKIHFGSSDPCFFWTSPQDPLCRSSLSVPSVPVPARTLLFDSSDLSTLNSGPRKKYRHPERVRSQRCRHFTLSLV